MKRRVGLSDLMPLVGETGSVVKKEKKRKVHVYIPPLEGYATVPC